MERTDTTTKIVSLLLFMAMLAYLGTYIYRSLSSPIQTAPAVMVSIEENGAASGIIVRNESIIQSDQKFLSVVVENGHAVSKGETIAVAYSGEDALSRASQIQELKLKKQYISSVLSGASSAENLNNRDTSIKNAITALAASSARRETDTLSSAYSTLSSLVIQNSKIGTTQADLDSVNSQLSSLEASALQDTVAITAAFSGLYSNSPDGYEFITPDMLSDLTPDKLKSLEASPKDVPSDEHGKLTASFEWYFASAVSEKDTQKLKVGSTVKLDFGRYCSHPLDARIISISDVSNGEYAVVFRCTEATSEMLSVRRATAEIVYDAHEGIRVPKEAVLTDGKGPFVYTVTGLQAEKKYITITWETDDYYIAAVSKDASGLKVGNDIITTTKGITDGKVLKD